MSFQFCLFLFPVNSKKKTEQPDVFKFNAKFLIIFRSIFLSYINSNFLSEFKLFKSFNKLSKIFFE